MAQPNVSREPSMEEILASIRRIIESNEAPAARGFEPMASFDADLPETDAEGFGSPLDLPVPANQPGTPFVESDAGRAPQKNVSLADLAARVRAASERGENVADEPHHSPMAAASEHLLNAPRAHSPSTSAPLMPELRGALDAGPVGVPAFAAERYEAPPVREQPQAPVMAVAAPVAEAQPEARNLLSFQAGAQVARSFEELAAAVDGQQRRSLDEIAESMLRPMLQEWLDDNLPTMVERLVREEIERIARGPRR
ncbi:PopZ family protein [Allorhizobium undicola]|uniref:PopZ family protein n=1 Tax=Allorhizobium undicola TaxID=78527 RepID=UPI000483AAB3|nr:PopZ family protein [Allorhizobium undicola]